MMHWISQIVGLIYTLDKKSGQKLQCFIRITALLKLHAKSSDDFLGTTFANTFPTIYCSPSTVWGWRITTGAQEHECRLLSGFTQYYVKVAHGALLGLLLRILLHVCPGHTLSNSIWALLRQMLRAEKQSGYSFGCIGATCYKVLHESEHNKLKMKVCQSTNAYLISLRAK